ncbi:SMP-30/gluconolactonase/LRE family protein [Novipirellula artificiosorum]|uniref:Gluconolactonase n=1 Tax=Novipirellula artificiosorum TaxID=2528016 RepID=A0A5C6DX78_9BACT|nr:SMP-30/gluconolactonase/LRE family protein [Novipirellula artificiosorum]TWU40497.1 Gluconolactonase precursor [Novipirellula artificiosorum]
MSMTVSWFVAVRQVTLAVCVSVTAFLSSPMGAAEDAVDYPVPREAVRSEGIPVGKLIHGVFADSQIFPGTERDYWVYVPVQLDADTMAPIMVFQDGKNYCREDRGARATIVFDNLIEEGAMPPTIGLFINPGVVPAANEEALPRFNRSFEYDDVSDRYARFLLEEMIPFVESNHDLTISDDPNDCGICGASSGAIAAFAVAWNRPDAFRRVYSMIGTYVGLRGGDELATWVRKTEPKPLRIFLQDGSNDLNIYAGDWWMANQTLSRALDWAGYEHNHVWGEGQHNHHHGAAIFPDAMRWLWKDYPKPIATHWDRSSSRANEMLVNGAGWEKIGDGYRWAEGLAINDQGTLFFSDVPAGKIYRVVDGHEPELFIEDSGEANGLALGPDGRLYGASRKLKKILAWDLKTGNSEVVVEGLASNDLVVLNNGSIYVTDPVGKKVWLIDPSTKKARVVDTFDGCNGITVSPDQTLLYVAHFDGRFIYSYQIADDGSLRFKQPYFHLHLPAVGTASHADGMCTSAEGWLLSATESGIQVFDQPGRVNLIVPKPGWGRRVCYVRLHGNTMYAATADAVWKRTVKLNASKPFEAPVLPPKPGL